MANNKIDLNKLKAEIANEKKSKYSTPSNLGESAGGSAVPRDIFLHGLVKGLEHGVETPSTNLIKVVENTVTQKKGGAPIHKINETNVAPTTQQPEVRKKIDMSPERDEQLFADLEAKRKQTLAESIQNFNAANPTVGATNPVVNYNGKQLLTSLPQQTASAQTHVAGTPSAQINEAVLIESVQQIVNSHLQQNLGPIFDEAIKGTIIEMYAIERIKGVLNENRDLIKDVVIQTIKEIQAKNKAKKAVS